MGKRLPADFQLETERLQIRPYTQADFEDYFAYIMDAELLRLLGLRGVTDRTSALTNFRWLMEKRDFLALISKEEKTAIGHIALHPPYEAVAQCAPYCDMTGVSLSFALKASRRRQGVMLEALKALLTYLEKSRSIAYIDCEYADFNAASRELQRKLGFRQWGTEQFGDMTLIIDVRSI